MKRLALLVYLFCLLLPTQEAAAGNVMCQELQLFKADQVVATVSKHPGLFRARRFTTGNNLPQSFIFIDREAGYVYTSLINLTSGSHDVIKFRKARYFKRGIPAKRISLGFASDGNSSSACPGNSMIRSLELRHYQLLLSSEKRNSRIFLHDLLERSDPVLNI